MQVAVAGAPPPMFVAEDGNGRIIMYWPEICRVASQPDPLHLPPKATLYPVDGQVMRWVGHERFQDARALVELRHQLSGVSCPSTP